jgi:predicted hotdog family 3-hydroxylacyl-ACP dehydratase
MNKYLCSGELFEQILPQKKPMLFVTALVEADIEAMSGVVECEVGKYDAVCLDENRNMKKTALIEVMAQSIASISGYKTYILDKGFMEMGLLLSVRGCKIFTKTDIPNGTVLRIHVTPFFLEGDINIYETKVVDVQNNIVAQAKITVTSVSKDKMLELIGVNQ